jgi:osmoprotectant transport system substrate-binding protein
LNGFKQLLARLGGTPRRRAFFLLAIGLAFYGAVRIVLWRDTPEAVISIGSKNFSESLIVGELYALALERNGFRVERKFNLGGTLFAHQALKRGEIDVYPEYTGTGLMDVLQQPPQSDPDAIFHLISDEYARRWNLRWLTPSEANDSQALMITRKTAKRYNLYTLSRLSKLAPRLRLASIPEFEERLDGLPGLKKAYGGFRFKEVSLYEGGLRYSILKRELADVSVGFSTDGMLSDPTFVLLEDDRHFWPPYRIAPVMRGDTLTRFPKARIILNRVSAHLDTPTLQRLNADVDLRKHSYQRVAAAFIATLNSPRAGLQKD